MIRTVTLNTGFDEIYYVSGCSEEGNVGALEAHETVASGKGVNAARASRALGSPTKAYGLIGMQDEVRFTDLLGSDDVASRFVTIDEPTRHNVTIVPVNERRVATHFRAPGYTSASEDMIGALAGIIRQELRGEDVVVLSGSTPSLDATRWLDIGRVAGSAGARLVLDLYGRGMEQLLQELKPRIAKPNLDESAALVTDPGRPVQSALETMAGCGVQLPIITLGQHGAAFLADGIAHVARCQIAEPRILVGAGDVFAAALAVGLDERQDDPVELVSWASAVAGAYVSGEALGGLRAAATALLDRVEVRPAKEASLPARP